MASMSDLAIQELTTEELGAWRGLLRVHSALVKALDAELLAGHELPLTSYEVLINLQAAPDKRRRMAELADSVKNSRSRITHTIARMEREGIVERRQCAADGRGVFAILTDKGYALLEDAAPVHVESVRNALIDVVDGEDLQAVARAFASVADALTPGKPDPILRGGNPAK